MKNSKMHYMEGVLFTTDNMDEKDLIKLSETNTCFKYEDNKLIVRQAIPEKLFNELNKTLSCSVGTRKKEQK